MKTLAAVAVLVLVPLGTPAAAEAAGPTCQGKPATLVGKPGKSLTGTSGSDVMVSRGSSHVNGMGGADLICITGATPDGYRVRVTGGDGDDAVLVTTTNTVRAFLGDGADTYLGGDEVDLVYGGDFDDDEFLDYRDDDVDSFSTGGGDDSVSASDADTIVLGAGDDELQWEGPAAAPYTGEADGGSGRNYLALTARNVEGEEPASWVLDSRVGTLSREGQTLVSWTRFTRFGVLVDTGLEGVLLRGSARSESFYPSTVGLSGSPITVQAGRGDDTIDVGGRDTPGELELDIDGGPGRDLLHVYGYEFVRASLVLDLLAGNYRYKDDESSATALLARIEDAEVQGIPEVKMRGDMSANRLTVRADQTDFPVFKRCQVIVSGYGGADRLTLLSAPVQASWKKCPTPVLQGQAGNDVLVGSRLDEKLLGGPGRDVARGGPGIDVCTAETRMGCERQT
jgi:hypothetical protein